MAKNDLEALRRTIEWNSGKTFIRLYSDISDVSTALQMHFGDQIFVAELLPDDHQKLLGQVVRQGSAPTAYVIDIRDPKTSDIRLYDEKLIMLNLIGMNRNGGPDFAVIAVMDEDCVGTILDLAHCFFDDTSAILQINKADLPPVIEGTTKEVFGRRALLSGPERLRIGDG